VDLRPLTDNDYPLLRELEEQEDVWESVGALPAPEPGNDQRLFVILDRGTPLGIGGLVRSPVLDGKDFEVLCALRSEAQLQGYATRACERLITWAFDTAKLERVIACIDDANTGARTIAAKLGMTPLGPIPPGRTVYVKYRGAASAKDAAG